MFRALTRDRKKDALNAVTAHPGTRESACASPPCTPPRAAPEMLLPTFIAASSVTVGLLVSAYWMGMSMLLLREYRLAASPAPPSHASGLPSPAASAPLDPLAVFWDEVL